MHYITSINQIDFKITDNCIYVFPKGVLIYITKHTKNKFDITVTNANYDEKDFKGKSFKGNEKLGYFLQNVSIYSDETLLEYWIRRSQITLD